MNHDTAGKDNNEDDNSGRHVLQKLHNATLL
jgi:hypothetical protein